MTDKPIPQHVAFTTGLRAGKVAKILRQAYEAALEGQTTRIEGLGGSILVTPEHLSAPRCVVEKIR